MKQAFKYIYKSQIPGRSMYAIVPFVELSRENLVIVLTAPWKARTKCTVFPAIESLSISLSKSQTLVYRRIKIIGCV